MKPTTEEVLNIQKQPDNFCTYIDPILDLLKDFTKEAESNIKDLDNQRGIGDPILLLDKIYLPSNPCDTFDILIDEMEKWATGWLELFEKSIGAEKDLDYKKELNDLCYDFSESIRIFSKEAADSYAQMEKAFNELDVSENYYNGYVNNYNEIDDEEVTEENEPCVDGAYEDLVSEFKDIDSAFDKYSNSIEELRSLACSCRSMVNDKLKTHTKIQLTRIENEEWIDYMNWFLTEVEMKNWKVQVQDCKELGLSIV